MPPPPPLRIVPLHGHAALRRRLRESVARGALPASLLIQGPRGIGKQRLALWLGQLLLCESAGERPCGQCQNCRYADMLGHPDLRWFFPRPRLKDADGSADEVLADYVDGISERIASSGLYAAPSGTEGIFVSTVRAIVRMASMTPMFGRRKVFVVGDAERMVPQEGSEFAANTFLKVLEEPPEDTSIILTSSEPGSLLPTIRSRVVTIRAAPLGEADVRAFLGEPAVATALDKLDLPRAIADRIRLAAGAPGNLFSESRRADAVKAARALLASVGPRRAERYRASVSLGGSNARGFFLDVLDSLNELLHERMRETAGSDPLRALASARAIHTVEKAKLRAGGNVSPQLLGASLLAELSENSR